MKHHFTFFNSIFILAVLFCLPTTAQNNDVNNYYAAFDAIISHQNTPLYNGLRYVDAFRATKEKHRYYKHYDFLKGNVVYNGQPYFNLDLKYDLYEDVLITRLSGDKDYFYMVFTPLNVSEFNIENHKFVNFHANKSLAEIGINGYLEQAYIGERVSLYIKHYTPKREELENKKINHLFNKKSLYILLKDGVFYNVNSKRHLKSLHLITKKALNDFYSSNHSLYKTHEDKFMVKLITFIDNNLK
ncbi:MAG: hypothetical protein GYB39_06290 [Algicola sp.]|nr:hypothetical protein [Algicola sp.]